MNFDPCVIIEKSGKHKQEHELVVPTGIKEIRSNQQQDILDFQISPGAKPIQEENDREKYGKVYRIE